MTIWTKTLSLSNTFFKVPLFQNLDTSSRNASRFGLSQASTRRRDIQHDDTKPNDTERTGLNCDTQQKLYFMCPARLCCVVIILHVPELNVVMPSVVRLKVIKPSVVAPCTLNTVRFSCVSSMIIFWSEMTLMEAESVTCLDYSYAPCLFVENRLADKIRTDFSTKWP